MKKVILNKDFGGFDISKKGYELYAKKKGLDLYMYETEFKGKNCFYKKTNDDALLTQYFTKDFGDNIDISEEDYRNYSLYLDGGHREDPILIEVVEELKEKANGKYSELKIVEIPDDLDYVIDNYDGIETLHQRVQEW